MSNMWRHMYASVLVNLCLLNAMNECVWWTNRLWFMLFNLSSFVFIAIAVVVVIVNRAVVARCQNIKKKWLPTHTHTTMARHQHLCEHNGGGGKWIREKLFHVSQDEWPQFHAHNTKWSHPLQRRKTVRNIKIGLNWNGETSWIVLVSELRPTYSLPSDIRFILQNCFTSKNAVDLLRIGWFQFAMD